MDVAEILTKELCDKITQTVKLEKKLAICKSYLHDILKADVEDVNWLATDCLKEISK